MRETGGFGELKTEQIIEELDLTIKELCVATRKKARADGIAIAVSGMVSALAELVEARSNACTGSRTGETTDCIGFTYNPYDADY